MSHTASRPDFLRQNRTKTGKESLILEVIVSPRASKTQIQAVYDQRIKIQVAAPPSEGSANQALLKYLAKILDLPASDISILSGNTGRRKSIEIAGMNYEAVLEKLECLLASRKRLKGKMLAQEP